MAQLDDIERGGRRGVRLRHGAGAVPGTCWRRWFGAPAPRCGSRPVCRRVQPGDAQHRRVPPAHGVLKDLVRLAEIVPARCADDGRPRSRARGRVSVPGRCQRAARRLRERSEVAPWSESAISGRVAGRTRRGQSHHLRGDIAGVRRRRDPARPPRCADARSSAATVRGRVQRSECLPRMPPRRRDSVGAAAGLLHRRPCRGGRLGASHQRCRRFQTCLPAVKLVSPAASP